VLKAIFQTLGLLLICSTSFTSVALPPPDLELVPIATELNRPVVARHAGDGSGPEPAGVEEVVSWQAASDLGGGNYGWNCKEGSSDNLLDCAFQGTLIDPILEYQQSDASGCAVTGGYVYRGSISEMRGDYIYSDYCNGRIWFASKSGSSWSETLWQDTSLNPSAFGEDEAGELYLFMGRTGSQNGIPAIAPPLVTVPIPTTGWLALLLLVGLMLNVVRRKVVRRRIY